MKMVKRMEINGHGKKAGNMETKRAGLALVALLFLQITGLSREFEILATKGKGALLSRDGHLVLRLEGTPFEMGFQHGFLLKKHVRTLVKRVLWIGNAFSRDEKGFFGGAMENAWKRTRPWIDSRFLEEMRGLARGSGVRLEDIKKANILPELFHCSGFALWGKATKDGRLLHGRILDYMTRAGIQDHAVTVVAKPDGGIPFMNVGFAGLVGSVTGMNKEGIAIGEMGGRGVGLWDGTPMAFLVRKALENANTLKQAIEIFRRARRTCEYFFVVSDAKIPRAVGMWCKPHLFHLIEPGKPYPRLGHPFEDAVLLSLGRRYEELARRVAEGYGNFGPRESIDLMKRPVAMESNLQCVLFDPGNLDAYVQIAADPKEKDYQACFQPVFKVNMGEVLGMEIKGNEMDPSPGKKGARPEVSLPDFEEGIIGGDVRRPLKPEKDPRVTRLLRAYELPGTPFRWKLEARKRAREYKVYELVFPSPFKSRFKENNTVYCEYFRSKRKGKRPAAIVLHILDGRFMVARLACSYLARKGIHGLLLKMAYYGKRRPKGMSERVLTKNVRNLVEGVRQTVLDIRRAALWLSRRPEVDKERISIVGVSLGGFAGALASGVDGNFHKTAVILAGGGLDKVVLGNSREVKAIKKAILNGGFTGKSLVKLLEPIEPCVFAHRIPKGTLLMVNTKWDRVVPVECAEALFKASGGCGRIVWYPGNHYSLTVHALSILNDIVGFIGN